MNIRDFLLAAEAKGYLRRVKTMVDPYLEMARVIHALGEELTLFESVKSRSGASPWLGTVVAGVCSQRKYFALALGVEERELIPTLVRALNAPMPPERVSAAPCQEVVLEHPDANWLPILTHFSQDGGPYITSGVAIIRDVELGRNLAFHRLMQAGPRAFTARLVEGRGTHTAWLKAERELPMAVCIGAPPAVQLAAAMSPAPGVDELAIANALTPLTTVRAVGLDLEIPAECEIVLEGRLTKTLGDEGPFVDLTGTRDFVRQQPVFVLDRITHRRTPIYQALLPGGYEHKLLMGMPREPTIFDAVSRVCRCLAVNITPGGCSWLHAVVQIAKRSPDDGRLAVEAAFKGHSSLKHVVVVDEDVNPFNMEEVEWAIATRFQADRDFYLFRDQPSSSLDPSARHVPGQKARTAKMGLDATIHWDTPDGPTHVENYRIVRYGEVDLARYLSSREGA